MLVLHSRRLYELFTGMNRKGDVSRRNKEELNSPNQLIRIVPSS